MNGRKREQPEELLVGLMADYEEALAADAPTKPIDDTAAGLDPQLAAEWDDAKQCLELLEEARRNGDLATVFDVPLALSVDSHPGSPNKRRLGRFLIDRELGRGGLGIVYLAHDPQLRRDVALKIPRFEALLDGELRRRFLREAEAAARLNHPNLVSLHEVGEDGTTCYLATEYCPGPTLAQWLAARRDAVPPREAAAIVLALSEAMEHAHGRGVLHRDIKPSNVLMSDNGAGDDMPGTPKLTDFGMAKLLEQQGDRTRSGAILGTLAYMAPEQAEGRIDELDCRTDIYALGAILYELLVGYAPYRGKTDADTLRQLIASEPVAPLKLRPDVPRDLQAIALKCLAGNPAARYATARELAADLQRFLRGEPTEARPLRLVTRAVRWTRRRPAIAALWLVSATAVLAVLAINARRMEDVGQARTFAKHESQRANDASTIKRRLLYTSQMRNAQQAYRDGDLILLRNILGQYADGTAESGLRHFEWYHLNYLANFPHQLLRGPEGEVYGVAYSPDGQILVTGGQDGTVRLWNAANGDALAVLREHTSCVNDLDFSPDGDTFVSSSCDKTIKLWSSSHRKVLATLTEHTHEVDGCRFIDEGRTLASMSRHIDKREVRLWDVATRTMRTDWPSAGEGGQGFVASRTGERLVTYSNDQAAIWQRRNDTWALSHRSDRIAHDRIGVFSKDEEYLIVPQWRHYVSTYRLSDGLLINQLNDHSDMVNGLAISPSGDQLATASSDSSVRVFDFPSGLRQHCLLGHHGRVWRVVWSPAGDSLATVGADGTARIWDLRHRSLPTPLKSAEQQPRRIHDVAFLQDGRHVNVVYSTGDSELWTETGEYVPSERVAGPRLDRIEPLSGKSRFHDLAYALLPQWDARTWANPSLQYYSPDGELKGFDSCARLIAGGSQLMEIAVGKQRKWSLDPFQIIEDRALDPELSTKVVLDISQDGQYVCSMRRDHWIEVYSLANHTVIDLVRDPTVKMARFSPDGTRILVTLKQVCEYDARTGAQIRTFSTRSTSAANYSGDGQRIGIASNLGFLTVFDAVTGEETLRLDTSYWDGLVFAADHLSLIVHNGGVVYCWPGKSDSPLEAVRP
jgi:WD40 repeat protein